MNKFIIKIIIGLSFFLSQTIFAQKHVINWVQDATKGHPQYLYDHWAQIETLPFDAVIIFPPQFRDVMSNTAITYQSVFFNSQLSLLKTKTDNSRVKNNFLMAWGAYGPFDPFDDWNTCIANFAVYAKVAKDAGCLGILFDDEQYYPAGHHIWQYPADFIYTTTHTEAEYRTQMRLRGNQIMSAMVTEFPNIQIIFSHGPYWSEPQAFIDLPQLDIEIPPNLRNGILLGSFFSGFVEASNAAKMQNHNPKVIDGGEIYSSFVNNYYYVLTQNDYEVVYKNWRNITVATNAINSLHIPPAIRGAVWSDNVSISYGLFNGWGMTPPLLQNHIKWALRSCEDLIWYYNEGQDWYSNDPAVVASLNDWKIAIQNGILSTVLSAKFIGFNANENENICYLNWKVENEISVDRYEIQRSIDGINFIKMGEVLYNSNANSSYAFKDNASSTSTGKIYYRIKQYDSNGSFYFSNIVSLLRQYKNNKLSIYPNPVKNYLYANLFNNAKSVATISVINNVGVRLISQQEKIAFGNNSFVINAVNKLQSGSYLLSIKLENGEEFTENFVKE